MKHSPPVIMFDLDGTLFDTALAIATAFNATFVSKQLPAKESQDICDTIGLPLETAFSHLLNQPENTPIVAECVAEYQRQFQELILPAAKQLLFPGVLDGLSYLKNHQFKLAVTTNKFSRSANLLLTAAGIVGFFDVVVCADEVEEKKPAPESGQRILDHFQASKEQALMVGDTTHDIFMANNLGCKAIAVNYGIHSETELKKANPTWMAKDFHSVVDICDRHFN